MTGSHRTIIACRTGGAILFSPKRHVPSWADYWRQIHSITKVIYWTGGTRHISLERVFTGSTDGGSDVVWTLITCWTGITEMVSTARNEASVTNRG
jgi:hypothetical protein